MKKLDIDPYHQTSTKPNKQLRRLALGGAVLGLGAASIVAVGASLGASEPKAPTKGPVTSHVPKDGFQGVTNIEISGPLNLRTSPKLELNSDGSVSQASNNNIFRKLRNGDKPITAANGFEYVSDDQAWVGIKDSKAPDGYLYANIGSSSTGNNVLINGVPANEAIPPSNERVVDQNHQLVFKDSAGVQPLAEVNLPKS